MILGPQLISGSGTCLRIRFPAYSPPPGRAPAYVEPVLTLTSCPVAHAVLGVGGGEWEGGGREEGGGRRPLLPLLLDNGGCVCFNPGFTWLTQRLQTAVTINPEQE